MSHTQSNPFDPLIHTDIHTLHNMSRLHQIIWIRPAPHRFDYGKFSLFFGRSQVGPTSNPMLLGDMFGCSPIVWFLLQSMFLAALLLNHCFDSMLDITMMLAGCHRWTILLLVTSYPLLCCLMLFIALYTSPWHAHIILIFAPIIVLVSMM